VKSWQIWHQKLINLPTSFVSRSLFTLRNPKKSFNNAILLIRPFDYLRYLRIKRTVTVTVNFPTTSEKCYHTTLWNAVMVYLIEGILFSSKCWWRSTEFEPMSQRAAAATRPHRGFVLDAHAPASCPAVIYPDLDKDCWLATCQGWWTRVSHGAEA